MKVPFVVFIILCWFTSTIQAQSLESDTARRVDIISAAKLEFRKKDSATDLQILTGNVRLKQGGTYFNCDSCIINSGAKLFEAFGHVHINDNDTVDVYSNYLRYLTDKRLAYLKGNVKLTDGHGTLTTSELDYDVNTKIGTYNKGGKVVTKNTVLTSKEGVYYADLRDVYFKRDVELKDPAYYLKSDSLIYNTESQVAHFISDTYIRDSNNRTIHTKEGYYDLKGGKSEFTQRTTIEDKSLKVTGDQIANDEANGIAQVRGRAVMIDTAKGISILANEIFVNKNTDAVLATQKPLMIIRQDQDSIYVTADTLFSARLTDLFKQKDSTGKIDTATNARSNTDSTNRYFEAFRHVRIYTDSVQAVSDSLFYSFKDSTFQLFQAPVVWSNGSQITGDTIYLYTKNKKADRVQVFENSFMAKEVEAGVYNQIKATRMDGFFKEGMIDSVRARGTAQSVYFIQNEDSSYTGVNQSQSDVMDVYFDKGQLYKVVLRSSVQGTYSPVTPTSPGEKRLEKFEWLEAKRPKTKYDLFE